MIKDQFLSSSLVWFCYSSSKNRLMQIIKCNVTEISGKGDQNKPFRTESPLEVKEDGSVP